MATSLLKSWLTQRDAALCWVEYEAYARRVFASDSADWYRDPARHAATLIQARGVVPTQCLSVDVTAPFLAQGAPADAAALVSLLGRAPPLEFLSDALAALAHRFEGKVDLVLKFTAPWDLLGGVAAAPEFDALDDVGTALAACMRRFADRPLAGVLLETARTSALSADEIDAYQPLFSAARHYGWFTALSLPADDLGVVTAVDLDVDVLLWPQRALQDLARSASAPRHGGGLTTAFWHGAAALGAVDGALLYGSVPADAVPETVVSVARSLPA